MANQDTHSRLSSATSRSDIKTVTHDTNHLTLHAEDSEKDENGKSSTAVSTRRSLSDDPTTGGDKSGASTYADHEVTAGSEDVIRSRTFTPMGNNDTVSSTFENDTLIIDGGTESEFRSEITTSESRKSGVSDDIPSFAITDDDRERLRPSARGYGSHTALVQDDSSIPIRKGRLVVKGIVRKARSISPSLHDLSERAKGLFIVGLDPRETVPHVNDFPS